MESTLANHQAALAAVAAAIVACRRCPRLIEHCQAIAAKKKRQFRDELYWGKPVPGFGDPAARLLVIGLAPAAHGGNRTGRVFTGDDSGDWLYEALYRFGFANQPFSRHRDDGLRLIGAYVTAAARCAPPNNKPLPAELAACQPYLEREIALLPTVRVVLVLGRIAFGAYLRIRKQQGHTVAGLAFGHGLVYRFPGTGLPTLVCSYHPSRQNTNTGKLTREMWHHAFALCRQEVEGFGQACAGSPGEVDPWHTPP
jgi:uracil-DNA glycosylase family 4